MRYNDDGTEKYKMESADETIMAVGQAHKNYDIVKRLKKLDKKFRDTDWKFLSNTQPVEYSYALRFHSMIQEILGEEK